MIEQIREEINQVSYDIECSPKTNEYTLVLKSDNKQKYALSKYGPRENALKMLGEDWGNRSTIWILFGFGFGYMLEEIVRFVGRDTRILIVEPNKLLLNEQIGLCNKDEVLKGNNIRIITYENFSNLRNILNEFIPCSEFNNINIRCIDSYMEYYNKSIGYVLKQIKEVRDRGQINFNTILNNEGCCIVNTIKNRYSLKECYDLSCHKDKYSNIPALIVAAGPSLQKNIEQIRKFNGIIIVIGRTMTPILEKEIKVDFVFSLDPFDVIHETFGKYKEHDIPLVTLTEGNWRVVEGSKGPKYFLGNNSTSMGLLGIKVNPGLSAYGSVSTMCISTATYMGCNPIILVGQDLAYTGGKKHSDVAIIDSEIGEENLVINLTKHPTIKGYYGGEVESDYAWISVIRWIETYIQEANKARDKEIIYINATEGGAYIEGALHLSLKETIEKYCIHKKPSIKHVILNENSQIDVDQQLKVGLKKLRAINRLLGIGKEYYKRLAIQYDNCKKTDKQEILRLIKKIERIDRDIMNIEDSNKLIEILMEKVKIVLSTSNNSKEPLNETEEERRLRACNLNCETYEYLFNESRKLIDFIKGEIDV